MNFIKACLVVIFASSNVYAASATYYSKSTNTYYTKINKSTGERARVLALTMCQEEANDCKLAQMTNNGGYGGIAVLPKYGRLILTGLASEQELIEDLLRTCKKAWGRNCKVIDSWRDEGEEAEVNRGGGDVGGGYCLSPSTGLYGACGNGSDAYGNNWYSGVPQR